MLGAAVVAMVWANSPWASTYLRIVTATFGPEALHLHLPLAVWAADFLLAFFFFLAGLGTQARDHPWQPQPAGPGGRSHRRLGVRDGRARGHLLLSSPGRTRSHARAGASRWPRTSRSPSRCWPSSGRGLPLALRGLPADPGGGGRPRSDHRHRDLLLRRLPPGAFIGALACVGGSGRRSSTGGCPGTWSIVLGYVPLAVLAWYLTHESGIHATVAGVALALVTRVRTPGRSHSPGHPAERAAPLRRRVRAARVRVHGGRRHRPQPVGLPGQAEVPPSPRTLTSPVALGVIWTAHRQAGRGRRGRVADRPVHPRAR